MDWVSVYEMARRLFVALGRVSHALPASAQSAWEHRVMTLEAATLMPRTMASTIYDRGVMGTCNASERLWHR